MMRRLLASCLALGSLFFVASCSSQTCTLIGCRSGVEARFRGTTTTAGLYQVEVVADGVPSTCQITLPFDCATAPACSAAKPNWHLKFSGCGPDASSIEGFEFFYEPPAKFDYVIRRDSEVIGGGTASPAYVVSYPNGPDCGECRSAPPFDVDLM